jgi:hypothetical protein
MTKLDYTLDRVGGFCPVQAEGTFEGEHFYFRARGNRWAFYIGKTTDPLGDPTWTYGESYGKKEFEAGWMSEAKAVGFIEKSLRLYLQV